MGINSAADMAAFREAAASGQLGIDPDAATVVLGRIRAGKDAVEQLMRNAAPLAQPLKVGANPVGSAMAAKANKRAAGQADSYEAALRSLFDQYAQVEQAIVIAMRRYRETDTAGADPFRGI